MGNKIRVKGNNGVEFLTTVELYEKYKQYLVKVADVREPDKAREVSEQEELERPKVVNKTNKSVNRRGRKN